MVYDFVRKNENKMVRKSDMLIYLGVSWDNKLKFILGNIRSRLKCGNWGLRKGGFFDYILIMW